MKFLFHPEAPAYDTQAIHDTIQRALKSAGLDTRSGPMQDARKTIRRALSAAGLPAQPLRPREATADVIDAGSRWVDGANEQGQAATAGPDSAPPQAPAADGLQQFRNRAGHLAYKVHVPAQASTGLRPLVVMLHGCTQSADDFAAGTRMNLLADAHNLLVVYPEQAAHANPSRCWNWFRPQDQVRDGGEPSMIAGIVREVAARHGADPQRIFVAGLSAGGAMAVVLGQTYPDLFAGVGVHSGLPYASAQDMATALAAMKGGRSGLPGARPATSAAKAAKAARAANEQAAKPVPVIVFHGDRDHTVQQANGAAIVRQTQTAYQAMADAPALQAHTQAGQASGGRRYSRTIHADAAGQAHIESWTLHGAGHAWSGGDSCGTYTDGTGPDASAEMVRFFLALPRRPAA